jgi:site-specific DNA recombinase
MIDTAGEPDAKVLKTAISYLRVSTKEQAEKGGQAEGFSIPAQREANRRKAQSLGAAIVAEFIDAGESARSADRPDLKRMLTYLAETPTDFVLVHKVDRLARNRVDDVEITMAIKKSGAVLVSATENIDETPSGMLLHGIMSSIAEFYSRNLATEVHKGMTQKAITGGTPNRAPLGYRNVGRITSEGREERIVEIDPKRASLITWAFTAYATGEWTVRTLANELELRGLTSRRTPKLASHPLSPHVLHVILTNPYYKGDVSYRGVTYNGSHQPLIDAVTWQRVQDVLAMHAVGEKQRDHPHYLKSSVFCGDCGSRFIITNSKNRHGSIYPYFICLGRHQKTTTCKRKAVLITKVEELVEDHWATVQLEPELRDAVEEGLRNELAFYRREAEDEHKHLSDEKVRLTEQRKKLMEAIYGGAVPMDLIASEQERIAKQLTAIESRLGAATAELDKVEANLSTALDLVQDCHAAYLAADASLRRLFNQAFFTHLMIEEHGVIGKYAAPFDMLLSDGVVNAGRAIQTKHAEGSTTMARILQSTPGSNEKTLGTRCVAGGLVSQPSTSTEGGRGLNVSNLVRLYESLSSLSPPLLRLAEVNAQQRATGLRKPNTNRAKAVIDQTGTTDPTAVRLRVKENHKLSAAAVEALVRARKAGASQAELAGRFDIQVKTVRRHLRRRVSVLVLGGAVISYCRSDSSAINLHIGGSRRAAQRERAA